MSNEPITVLVWQGGRNDRYEDLLEDDPDEYELPIADTEFGRAFEVSSDECVNLADEVDHHGTFAFDIPEEDRPVTLNVHTNDSYHDPDDWGKPLERGLPFRASDGYEPFQCEIWGRVMMWADRPEEGSR